MSGKMLCSFLLLDAQLGYFACGLFFFPRLWLLFGPSLSKADLLWLCASCPRDAVLAGSLERVLSSRASGLLSGELLGVVFVLHWDARLLRVLLAPLLSCRKELCVL
jgi:hypothetical protein